MTATPDVLPTVVPATGAAGPPPGRWTYADYAALPADSQRYEIVDGVLYMTPAPSIAHQGAGKWLTYYLTAHVEVAGRGLVFSAPIDVELGPRDVVQPDVIVVLNERRGIVRPDRIVGAPSLVIEILSPGTAGYDRRDKQDAYARAGVPEYWLADPAAQTIEVLLLEEGRYRTAGVFRRQAQLPSVVAPDLPVRVAQFFA